MSKRRPLTLAELRGRKQRKSEPAEQSQDDDLFDDLPSEVLQLTVVECHIATVLRSLSGPFPPLVSVNMLYSFSDGRTAIDREVEELCQNNKVMKFSLRSSSSFLMSAKSYHDVLRERLPRLKISVSNLIVNLESCSDQSYFSQTDLRAKFDFSDETVSALVREGLLIYYAATSRYEFSVPGGSLLVEQLTKGREEILKRLKLKVNKEILEKDLLNLKLKCCVIGVKYVIYDLVGRQKIESVKTSSGILLRIPHRT